MNLPRKYLSPALVATAMLACAAIFPAMAQREGADADNASKVGFVGDIVAATAENTDFRRVLYTGDHIQLVVMTIQPGQEIGRETHPNLDQFFRVEQGTATLTLGGEQHTLEPGFVAVVPAGVDHNFANKGDEPVHLYTLYAPPQHPPGTVQAQKPAE